MIRDDNYILIQGWMLNNLPVKNMNEVIVFATIYGFSQDGSSKFTGSLKYLSEITKTTKPTTIAILKNLVESELIIKHEQVINNVQFNSYSINLPVVKNFNWGSKEILPGVVKNFNGGSKEILPNNTKDISIDKYSDNNSNIVHIYDLWHSLTGKKHNSDQAKKAAIETIAKFVKKHGHDTVKNVVEFICTNPFYKKGDYTGIDNIFRATKFSEKILAADAWLSCGKKHRELPVEKPSYHTMGDFTGQESGEVTF